MQMLWPILLIIASNTIYHICSKSTPESIDPFASLTVTYLVAALSSLLLFFLTNKERALDAELAKLNWSPFVLGVVIIGLEFGFLSAYRVGWKVSNTSLVASTGLAVVLLFVGALLYKELITPRQLIGFAVCAVGLFLIAK